MGAVYSAAITYLAWDLTFRLMQLGQTSPTLQMPVYISYGLMLMACCLAAVTYLPEISLWLPRILD